MSNKEKKIIGIRHYLFRAFARTCFFFYSGLNVHYKRKNKYKIAKGEKVLILSNHQTDADYFYVSQSFNKPVFPVATESLFSNKFLTKALPYFLGAIPKKKGEMDLGCVLTMMRYIHSGAPVVLFVEGNRNYAEFQFHISDDIGKQVKKMKSTLVLFNLHGGTGIKPRFGFKRRKGPFYGEIKKVLKYEEYKDMDDLELTRIIKENLRVFDSESPDKYKSKRKAEYLEREFFICPVCGKMNTISSLGNDFSCSNCGTLGSFNELLRFEPKHEGFKFKIMNDWYQFQKQFVKSTNFAGEIFKDEGIKIFKVTPYVGRKRVQGASLISLSDKELVLGEKHIELKDIVAASPISGKNLTISTHTDTYLIKGHDKFNPLKYVLLFNKLDTEMKLTHSDLYYNLED